MADEEEVFESCAQCGATVYPEHLQKGLADRSEGRLICVHCLRAVRSESAHGTAHGVAVVDADEPIALVEIEEGGVEGADEPIAYDKKPTVIRSFGGAGGLAASAAGRTFRRPLLLDTPNATRCRVFHAKLADGAFMHMCEQINEWVDGSDEIQIKFVSSCIGVVEGKHADQHLIMTVFY
jgi:hypothetical protein